MAMSMVRMSNFEQARKLCTAGKFHEASEQFTLLASQSSDSLEKASYLIEAADCYRRARNFEAATSCAAEARKWASDDAVACAQVDFFIATLLINQNKHEEGLKELAKILTEYSDKLKEGEGRELYQEIQMQRGISLMHLSCHKAARPVLEEVVSFQLSDNVISDFHCHLGRCYHELGLYRDARQQFERSRILGISEEWQSIYHYYFGYTLYELNEFGAARREFILSLQSGGTGPPQSYVYKMLAATCRKLGDNEQARLYDKMEKSS